MMMQQPYHGGSDYDACHRTLHRNMTNAAYYDRAAPYGPPYESRHELRQEYSGRVQTHTSIQEPDEGPLTAGGQARRRIAVACARCRRRKIKCSGDPGDGTGCQACRSSGARHDDCNFHRMHSKDLEVMLSDNNGTGPRPYNVDESPDMGNVTPLYSAQHRPSLPVLQSRTTWPTDYDSQYESSPVDTYTYGSGSAPRHDSIASSYGSPDAYRSYGSSAPLPAPVSSPFYEQGSYSFGTLQSPVSGYTGSGRSPSVSADSMSVLNMGSLHSSLPSHAPLERRLPPVVPPYSITYPQRQSYSHTFPEPRPIDPATVKFKPHINHISGHHSRAALPWSAGTKISRSNPPGTHAPGYASTSSGQHQITGTTPTTTGSVADPILGYQFQAPPGSYSPDSSPIIVPTLGEPFPSMAASAMPPPTHHSNVRYSASSTSLPAISASFDDARASSSRLPEIHAPAPLASLYSYSTEICDRSSSEATARDHNHREGGSPSGDSSESDSGQNGDPQSRHSSSHNGIRRQSDYDHQRTSGGPGHRMGRKSLNERY